MIYSFLWYNSKSLLTHRLIYLYLFLKGDVYPVEPSGTVTVNQVLNANWGVLNDDDVSKKSYFCSYLGFFPPHSVGCKSYTTTITQLCSIVSKLFTTKVWSTNTNICNIFLSEKARIAYHQVPFIILWNVILYVHFPNFFLKLISFLFSIELLSTDKWTSIAHFIYACKWCSWGSLHYYGRFCSKGL